jgi:hypothetical protein
MAATGAGGAGWADVHPPSGAMVGGGLVNGASDVVG